MSVSVGLTKRNTFTNSKNTGDFSIANSSHTFFISFSTKLETSTFLNKFRYKSKPLGVHLDVETDTENLFNLMLEQIYIPKEHFQLSQMDQSIELFMQGLKLNYVTKIENS